MTGPKYLQRELNIVTFQDSKQISTHSDMLLIINIVYSYDCPDDKIVHLQTDSSQICYSLHGARYLNASATT